VARLLVQLKLRLLGNALRSSRSARVAFILSTVAAGLVAVVTFAELAALRGKAASVDLTTVVFTVFAFGWLILPPPPHRRLLRQAPQDLTPAATPAQPPSTYRRAGSPPGSGQGSRSRGRIAVAADDRRGSGLCEVAAVRSSDAAPAGDGGGEWVMDYPCVSPASSSAAICAAQASIAGQSRKSPAGRAFRAAGMCCTNRSPRPTGRASGS
jgi:hypothetical protein